MFKLVTAAADPEFPLKGGFKIEGKEIAANIRTGRDLNKIVHLGLASPGAFFRFSFYKCPENTISRFHLYIRYIMLSSDLFALSSSAPN